MPPDKTYFGHIEGLRGITSLYVCLYHLLIAAVGPPSRLPWLLPWASPLPIDGHYAVAVFIVISGYCLGAPVSRNMTARFHSWNFAKRRLRRLYPAYVTALVLAIPAFYLEAATDHHHPSLSHLAVGIVSHLLLIHNLSERTREYLSGPMWTIALEVQIYIIFALLLVPVWKRFGAVVQLALALALSVIPHVILHGALDGTCPWFLALFAMGVLASDATLAATSSRFPWVTVATVLAVITIVVATLSPAEGSNSWHWFLPDLLLGSAVSVFFVASARRPDWLLARVLGARPLQFLGTFSYSLYLIHETVFLIVRAVVTFGKVSSMISVGAWVLSVPLALIAAYGLFLFAERPFLSNAFKEELKLAGVGGSGDARFA